MNDLDLSWTPKTDYAAQFFAALIIDGRIDASTDVDSSVEWCLHAAEKLLEKAEVQRPPPSPLTETITCS